MQAKSDYNIFERSNFFAIEERSNKLFKINTTRPKSYASFDSKNITINLSNVNNISNNSSSRLFQNNNHQTKNEKSFKIEKSCYSDSKNWQFLKEAKRGFINERLKKCNSVNLKHKDDLLGYSNTFNTKRIESTSIPHKTKPHKESILNNIKQRIINDLNTNTKINKLKFLTKTGEISSNQSSCEILCKNEKDDNKSDSSVAHNLKKLKEKLTSKRSNIESHKENESMSR